MSRPSRTITLADPVISGSHRLLPKVHRQRRETTMRMSSRRCCVARALQSREDVQATYVRCCCPQASAPYPFSASSTLLSARGNGRWVERGKEMCGWGSERWEKGGQNNVSYSLSNILPSWIRVTADTRFPRSAYLGCTSPLDKVQNGTAATRAT